MAVGVTPANPCCDAGEGGVGRSSFSAVSSLALGPGVGFLPSRIALRMSAAFHAAYRCLDERSSSISPNCLKISRNTLAA